MFNDISDKAHSDMVHLRLDGEWLTVPAGYTVAAVLLARQRRHNRNSAVSGALRGPFCLMGGCFECLVEIDGVSNRQACMTEVKEGMRVATQLGAGMRAAMEMNSNEL